MTSMTNQKSRTIYGLASVTAPVSGFVTYLAIASIVGHTDTTHGFFNVFLVVELLLYSSIAGIVSGLIGAIKKERPQLLSYIGLVENGIIATYFSVAILSG